MGERLKAFLYLVHLPEFKDLSDELEPKRSVVAFMFRGPSVCRIELANYLSWNKTTRISAHR